MTSRGSSRCRLLFVTQQPDYNQAVFTLCPLVLFSYFLPESVITGFIAWHGKGRILDLFSFMEIQRERTLSLSVFQTLSSYQLQKKCSQVILKQGNEQGLKKKKNTYHTDQFYHLWWYCLMMKFEGSQLLHCKLFCLIDVYLALIDVTRKHASILCKSVDKY